MKRKNKFLIFSLLFILGFTLNLNVLYFFNNMKVSAATVTITGTWTDNSWHAKQSDFSPPQTIKKSYTDSMGNTYNVSLSLKNKTYETKTGEVTSYYESFGRVYKNDHTTLGYMSNNPTTYWGGSLNFSDPTPRRPSDYYGPPVDGVTSWELVDCKWDESTVKDSFAVRGPGIYWNSDAGSGGILNRYRKGVYLKYKVTSQGTLYKGTAHYSRTITPVDPPKKPDDQTISGTIIFNPNSSSEVSIKGNEWSNTTMNINVSVQGDTTKKVSGEDTRTYNFSDSEDSTNKGTRTTKWYFQETWEIAELTITGSGTKPDGSTYTINTKINGASGNINIPTEVKDLTLNGVISKWQSKSKDWVSGSGTDPDFSSWSSSSPSATTETPTETYDSSSGEYFIDITEPTEEINKQSVDWTNRTIDLVLTSKDNFSGIDVDNSKLFILDSSHYRQPKETIDIGDPTTSFKINKNGIYNVDIELEDIAGNKHTKTYEKYKYDDVKPDSPSYSSDNREYIDDTLYVTTTCKDDLSGVSNVTYALTNSPTYSGEHKNSLSLTTREDSPNDTTSFRVTINKNGTWYIHTWVTDRAGNITYNHSNGYKYFKINPSDLVISPNTNPDTKDDSIDEKYKGNNVLRGSRFDLLTSIAAFKQEDVDNSTLYYTMPNWINDNINKKINGIYTITQGNDAKVSANAYLTPSNIIQHWRGFIPPYGTPLTKNMEGKVIGKQYTATIQLYYTKYIYGEKKTHPINKNFNVVHEQIIKTNITNNEK